MILNLNSNFNYQTPVRPRVAGKKTRTCYQIPTTAAARFADAFRFRKQIIKKSNAFCLKFIRIRNQIMLIKNHKTELDLQFYCGEFAFYYDFITHALPWSDSRVLVGIAHLVGSPSRDVPAVVTISRRVVFRGQSGAKLGEGTCFSLRKNFESSFIIVPEGESLIFIFIFIFCCCSWFGGKRNWNASEFGAVFRCRPKSCNLPWVGGEQRNTL